MIQIGSYLGVNLEGNYRQARWMAILAAAIFFPIFTIPGMLAIGKLERYRNQLLEPMRDAK